ncbi:MAG: hypothetical protein U0228_19450 [Myxococcaceae bacterium]
MPGPISNRPTSTPASSTTSGTTGTTGPATPTTTPATTPTTPAGWKPTLPTGSRLGADGMVTHVQVPKSAPIHHSGKATFEGAKIKPEVLTQAYAGVTAENFGSTTVKLPSMGGPEKSFVVHDLQYDLGGGKFGMKLVPVKDNDPASSKAMDELIRKESKLGPNDPIFTLVAYVHPEKHTGSIKDLGDTMLKTEMGNTHLGAYVGNAKTTNSPENYHGHTWEVKGYPANVQLISMAGTPQATLNKNLLAADSVLNAGVKFPPDYKNDPFRTVDLNTTLMFYRDWIKGEDYLKTDPSWATYCAEHKTIVTNIGLNVPHNEDSFKEIFGDAEGKQLWSQFKDKFKAANGREFTAADETHFEPLWKKEGLKAEQLKPPTKAEYDAYQKARFDGSLKSGAYHGYEPLPVGKAMAWKPETTADLVKNFAETYAPFQEVGGIVGAASILAFKPVVQERMGLSDQDFMKLARPLLQEMMAAEALARAPADPAKLPEWTQKTTGAVYVALGGKPADFAPGGTVNPQLMALAKDLMGKLPTVTSLMPKMANLDAGKRNDYATGWLRKNIQDELTAARGQMVSDPGKTEYYSPPAITNRVANGIVDSNKFVNIRVIATAVDASEVQ